MAKDSLIKAVVREVIREEIKPLEDRLINVEGYQKILLQSIKDIFQEFKNEFLTMKEGIMGELNTAREQQVILNSRSLKINDIEDKVDKLEEIHPNYTHATI